MRSKIGLGHFFGKFIQFTALLLQDIHFACQHRIQITVHIQTNFFKPLDMQCFLL